MSVLVMKDLILKRDVDKYLNKWILDPKRKPLLLDGANRVGKTISMFSVCKKFKSLTYLILFFKFFFWVS